MKQRVLVSCVGNQDPVSKRTGQEGAIVTAARYLKPDLVYLLPSMDKLTVGSSTKENKGKSWLQSSSGSTKRGIDGYSFAGARVARTYKEF